MRVKYTGVNINGDKIAKEILNDEYLTAEFPDEINQLKNMVFEKVSITTTEHCEEIINIVMEGKLNTIPFIISDQCNNIHNLNGDYKREITLSFNHKSIIIKEDNDDAISEYDDKIEDEELLKLYTFLFSGEFLISLVLQLENFCTVEEL